MRREYASRHARIMEALTTEFAKWLDPIVSVTGIHVAARRRSNSVRREGAIHARAAAAGVAFDTLSRYCAARPAQAGVVLGYGGIGLAQIDEGLRRLRDAFLS
jgi:GntR family transcriptional regulator / MocR family aminotransferase